MSSLGLVTASSSSSSSGSSGWHDDGHRGLAQHKLGPVQALQQRRHVVGIPKQRRRVELQPAAVHGGRCAGSGGWHQAAHSRRPLHCGLGGGGVRTVPSGTRRSEAGAGAAVARGMVCEPPARRTTPTAAPSVAIRPASATPALSDAARADPDGAENARVARRTSEGFPVASRHASYTRVSCAAIGCRMPGAIRPSRGSYDPTARSNAGEEAYKWRLRVCVHVCALVLVVPPHPVCGSCRRGGGRVGEGVGEAQA